MMTLIALVGAYFGLLIVLSLLVRPKRERMVALAHQLLSEEPSPKQALLIQRLLDSAYRVRSAPLQVLALIIMLWIPSPRFDREVREWAKKNAEIVCDRRYRELFGCHTASIAAANPIFGLLVYVGLALFHVKAWAFGRQLKKDHVPFADFEVKAADTFGRLKAAA